MTITGTNFNEATAVKFGSNNATTFKVETETSITATAPAGTGVVDVRVTTRGGQSATTSSDHFNYGPSVNVLEPNYGPPAGGTTVAITGTNFNEVTAVKFGSTSATSFTVNSPTSITAVSPAGTGRPAVTVVTAGGTSSTEYGGDLFELRPVCVVGQPSQRPGRGRDSGDDQRHQLHRSDGGRLRHRPRGELQTRIEHKDRWRSCLHTPAARRRST